MNNLLNFKSFIKFLGKNKSYTFIDVFGLSVSLMFVILIAVYTTQGLSTDKFQEKSDRIYALCNGKHYATAYKLAYRIQERFPEIEKVCPLIPVENQTLTIGDQKLHADVLYTDTTFFDMFSFDLIQGNQNRVLEARNYAVISETFANKAFPGRDPLGQSIKVYDSLTVTVNGIMKDIKRSTIKYADIVLRIENVRYFNQWMDSDRFNNAGSALIFLLAREGADIQQREEETAAFFKEIFWLYRMGIHDKVLYIPLKDIYFSDYKMQGYLLNQGDWKFILILMSVGIVILLFAIINYINLTVAQTGFRAKEMATRRLLGSSRVELFMRLMMESAVLSFISFVLGVVLAFLLLPYANNLLETKIFLTDAFTPFSLFLSFVLVILIGGITGFLPALIISNSKPVDVVKGSFRQKTKMVFSKFFITFQNLITITLIACSLTMVLQINHLTKAPLGYNTLDIIDISAESLDSKEQIFTLRNELEQLAVVKRVGLSQGTPFENYNNNTTEYNGMNVSFQMINLDQTAVDILGFEILQENNWANEDSYYFTEYAFDFLNIPDSTSSITTDEGWKVAIAGKVRNFRLRNITYTEEKEAVMLQIKRAEDFDGNPWDILVETQGDHAEAYSQVKEVYERVTGLDFEDKYLDQKITESFASQRRTARIVMVFTFIAILLSLLGLFAMSTYFIQQRSREIAVRKVFGSTNQEVLKKLVITFLNYVLIAFVIAIPFIWYIMDKWLDEYSYRITLHPGIFIAAGLFCLIISFITVYWQSYQAANANPVTSIKSE